MIEPALLPPPPSGRSRPRRAGARVLGSIILAAALVPAALRADIVHLKTGRTIEGTTSAGSKKGTVEIRKTDGSVVVVPETEIVRIEKRRSFADELDERIQKVPPGEIEPLLDLIAWARGKSLHSKVKGIARKALEIDPNNELARRELGYVVYENKWILESELRKKKGLIRFRDEWMTEEEKKRRTSEEALKEVEDLFQLVESGNPYIQEFSIQKILSRREPVLRGLFASRFRDPKETVRMVAVGALASFPAGAGDDPEAKRIAADLHRLALVEEKENVRTVIRLAARKFHPAESFRHALETASGSPEETERRRAAEILSVTIRKAAVPELCRAVSGLDGKVERKEIRDVLRRALGVDHGYDSAAWLRYWSENKAGFRD